MDSVLMERGLTRLGLALSLTDDFTGKQPIGGLAVSLDGKQALRNPSGYYLFLNMQAGAHQLKIETDFYFDQETDLNLELPSPWLTALTLKPGPAYPFAANVTLVRGVVYNAGGDPVSGATASIQGRDIEGMTTEQGEFVLYFKGLTASDIIVSGGKRYVRRGGSRNVKLQVTCPGYKKKTVQVEVEENRTAPVTITLTEGGGG